MIHKISLFPLILIHYSGYCKFIFLLWEFVLEMVLHVWYVPLPVCGADIDKTWTSRASLMFWLSAFSHWPTTACTVSFSPPRLWKTWSDVATCVWFCMNHEKIEIHVRLNLKYGYQLSRYSVSLIFCLWSRSVICLFCPSFPPKILRLTKIKWLNVCFVLFIFKLFKP